jgi:MFS family permease
MAALDEGQPLLAANPQHEYQSIAQGDPLPEEELIAAKIEDIKGNLSTTRVNASLTGILICLYLTAVNTTFFIPILNDVSSGFDASGQAFWIATSYLLASCVAAPIYTQLLQISNHKSIVILSVSIFLLGTALCTTAQSMYALIAYRTLAGLGGGGISQSFSILMQNLLPLRKQAIYQSRSQLIYAVGIFSGAPIGAFVSTWLGWRCAIAIQIPILAIASLVLIVVLKLPIFPSTKEQIERQARDAKYSRMQQLRRRLDLIGVLLLASACISMMLGLTFLAGGHLPFLDKNVWGCAILSACLLMTLIWYETRIAIVSFIPLALLKTRNSGLIVAYHFFNSTSMAVFFYSPSYFRSIFLQSASQVGARLISLTFSAAFGFYTSKALLASNSRLKNHILLFCLINLTVPIYISTWSDTNIPSILTQNFSLAPFAFSSTALTVIISSRIQKEPAVLALVGLARYLGTITGISFFGAQIQYVVTTELTKHISGPDASSVIDSIRKNANKNASLPDDLREIALQAWSSSLHIFHLGIALILSINLLIALCIKEEHSDDQDADLH